MNQKKRMINSSRYQKQATVLITKALEQIAEDTGTNVRRAVADKLEESYKANLELSYTPKSAKGYAVMMHNEHSKANYKKKQVYRHKNLLRDSIYTEIDGNYIKVKIHDETYDEPHKKNPKSTVEVYDYLTKGTNRKIGTPYVYNVVNGATIGAVNYPTEIHRFEDWTKLEMLAFLNSLEDRIKNGEYSSFRYTGKKKRRTHYRGVPLD